MKKIKNLKLLLLIFILSCIALGIAIIQMIHWHFSSSQITQQEEEILNSVTIQEKTDTEQTATIDTNSISDSDPYWDYIHMNLIDVNLENLKQINQDTVGWIQVPETNINYPFVQTDNNAYYLTHSFNHSTNIAGWVFLDYRNQLNEKNKNLILYAHGRLDHTMFGTLKNILSSNWLNDTSNHVIKLSTEHENTLWQVFSVYHIPTTSDYLLTNFQDTQSFMEFAQKLLDRSLYNFETTIQETDQILTLSTCYNQNEKMVLHAKLIKWEEK